MYLGTKTYKGDFIQTTSGKVLSQRTEGILYWEDIPFALPPLGHLRWKAPVAFIAEDFILIQKKIIFVIKKLVGKFKQSIKLARKTAYILTLEHLMQIEIIYQ